MKKQKLSGAISILACMVAIGWGRPARPLPHIYKICELTEITYTVGYDESLLPHFCISSDEDPDEECAKRLRIVLQSYFDRSTWCFEITKEQYKRFVETKGYDY